MVQEILAGPGRKPIKSILPKSKREMMRPEQIRAPKMGKDRAQKCSAGTRRAGDG